MLLRQTLLYLPAQFVAPAAQFVSALMWTWWLAPAEMGVFVLVSATQELAYLFSVAWFSTYALRYMPPATDRAAYSRFLGTETTLMVVLTLPQLLAAWIAVHVVPGSEGAGVGVAVAAAYFVTRSLNMHYAERARAQSAIVAYTILQVAGPLGGLGFGVLALDVFGGGSGTLLAAYAAAQAIGTVVALPLIGFRFRPAPIDRQILRQAISYGGPVLILSVLGWAGENNIRYVVEHVSGPEAFGLMAVGWGIGRRCASVASMLVMAAAFPLAARLLNQGDRDAAMAQLKVNAAMLAAVLFPTVAGVIMVGGLLTDLAVAADYRETTKAILGLSALAGALRFLHLHSTDQCFVLERRFVYAGAVHVAENVLVLAFAGIGLATWGLVGAVAGAAIGSGLTVLFSGWLAVTRLGFQIPVLDLCRIATATGFMATALAWTPYPQTATGLAVAVVLGGLSYAAGLAFLYLPVWIPVARRRWATA